MGERDAHLDSRLLTLMEQGRVQHYLPVGGRDRVGRDIVQQTSSPLAEVQSYPPAIAEGSRRSVPNLREWAEALHLVSPQALSRVTA